MRIGLGIAAALLFAGVGWSPSAQAQTPQGTYLRSCTNASAGGDTLTATCRRGDGREVRTSLSGYRRCAGDIGNNNGTLQCADKGGAQIFGQGNNEGPRGGSGYGNQGNDNRGNQGYDNRGNQGYGNQGYGNQGYGGPGNGGPGYGGPGGPPPYGAPPPGYR